MGAQMVVLAAGYRPSKEHRRAAFRKLLAYGWFLSLFRVPLSVEPHGGISDGLLGFGAAFFPGTDQLLGNDVIF